MDKSKVNICVIGTGRAGMIHAANFARSVDKARLTAIVENDEGRKRTVISELNLGKGYSAWQDAIDDDGIDAIIVATPTKLHCPIVMATAKAGKHILCEKPLAANVAECEAMLKVVSESKVKLQVGFMRRYDASFMAAKARIEEGEIGDVVLVKSLTHGPSIPLPWMLDVKHSNGPLAEVSSHDIDSLRWFTGSEYTEVYAIGSNYRCRDVREEYPDFYDNFIMTARFQNGMQGLIDGAMAVRYGYDSRVEILGTRGILFVGTLKENTVLGCSEGSGMSQTIIKSWRTLFQDAYLTEDIDFVKCILEDRGPKASGMDGMKAVEVVNAGNLSIKEQKPIKLELYAGKGC